MSDVEKKINLLDLIDIEFLQKFQDGFSDIMGIPSLTYGENEPITKPSNFVELCSKYIRLSELGQNRCQECDLKWAKLAAKKGEPIIYKCHAGITDFVVPIIIDGKHIASIYGGQIFTEKPNEDEARETAKQLNINEDEYIDALRKVKIIPMERVKTATQFLSLVANAISKIGHKNLQLIRKNERENLLRNVTEKIRSSLDIEEILYFICSETARLFNIQRSTITSFPNSENYEDFIMRKEYKVSKKIKGHQEGDNFPKTAAYWVNDLAKSGKIIGFDNIEESDAPDFFKNTYKSMGIKSIIGTSIKKGDDVWGTLILSEYNNYRTWTDEEKILLKTIADQVYIAINQAELFENEKKAAERERILRTISNKVKSSLDLEDVKHEIVNQVGKLLKADRVGISDVDPITKNPVFTEKSEYRSSHKVKTTVGVDFKNIPGFIEDVINIHIQGKDIIFNDLEKYIDEKNFRGKAVEKFYREFGFISSAAINIYNGEMFLGNIVITFENQRNFSEDEINLIKALADQAGVAIYQAKLYSALRQNMANQYAILNNMPFMAWLKDTNSRLLAVNNEYARMCSTTVEKLIGKVDFDLFPKEHAQAYFEEDQLVMQSKKTIESVDLILGPDGERLYETYKSPVFDDKGNVVGTVGISSDITEKKQLQADILDNKNKLNAILDNIPYWAWLKDKENKYILVNKRYAEDKNTTVEDFIGKSDYEFFPKELAAQYNNDDYNIMLTKESKTFEETTLINDEIRYLETSKQPFLSTNGEIIGTIGVAKDITERKETELELLYRQELIVKSAKRESLLRNITETIRSSLDIDETKQKIVDIIGKTLNVDRCLIIEYDKVKDEFLSVKDEYLSSDEIIGYKGSNINKQVPKFAEAVKKGQPIIINNNKIALETEEQSFNLEKEAIDKYHVRSAYAIPLYYSGELLGILSIHYVDRDHIISEDETSLINMVADQVATAIHQAKLYKSQKQISQREFILRKTTDIFRSTLDSEEIKNSFVEITRSYFNADRCLFDDYDKINKEFLPFRIEKLKSPDTKSLVGISVEKEFPEFATKLKKGRNIIIKDLEKTLSKKTLSNYKAVETLRNSDAKSDYGLLVKYKNQIIGILILHFTDKKRVLTHDELNFLKVLRDQVGIALYHAELFEKEQKQVGREKLLRHLIETIRQSLEINIIRKTIVNEIAKIFKADRCILIEFDESANSFLPTDEFSEYRSSPDVYSFVGYDFEDDEVKSFSESHRNLKTIYVEDVDEFIKNNNLQGTGEEKFLLTSQLKTGIGKAIFYQNTLVGVLAIHFVNEKKVLTPDDMDFITDVTIQAGGAIYQSRLLEKTKKTAERESLYRRIMEAIRQSLDIDETKKQIVNMIGKALIADRCFILEYDKDKDIFVDSGYGYLSSSDIVPYYGADASTEVPHFTEAIKQGKPIYINKKQIYLDPDNNNFRLEREAIEKYGVFAAYALPLYYAKELLGILSIQYVKTHEMIEDEIEFMNMIANQVAIAIHQAKLYKITQVQAEKEKLLRKTFETMRSSLDINDIKATIVTEVCKALNADRCFIMEYDKTKGEFLVVSDEYLASPDIPSYKGTDVNKDTPHFVHALKQGKHVIINNKEICLDGDIQEFEAEKETLDRYRVTSALAFPFYYSDELLGAMAVHYVDRTHIITEDEQNLLNIIANQIAIAIHQAKLYKLTQIQAERERIGRNIIEILRSSLDKKVIKRLFVKNLGKYFNANRVFFTDYDNEKKIYLPYDTNSEYLSSEEEKSFVGINLSNEAYRESFQQLLERREVKIYSLDEYKQTHYISPENMALFEQGNVKSSYSFPVVYQDKIMGSFSIEFTHEIYRLPDEDISRIRSICTQAGIALYQADLFEQAQESTKMKSSLIKYMDDEVKAVLINIEELSDKMLNTEVRCDKHIEHLNNINEIVKRLLDFVYEAGKLNPDKY